MQGQIGKCRKAVQKRSSEKQCSVVGGNLEYTMNESALKTRIYEATVILFNEKGMKFTMEDISKSLGISKKTLYQIIREKEQLLDEMVDYCFDGIKEEEAKILQSSLSVTEKIRQIIIVLPEQYRNIDLRQIRQIRDKYPMIYEKVSYRLETGWEGTMSLMQEAVDQGQIRSVSLPVVKAVIEGAFEHFLGSGVLAENQITYEEALESMMDIIMKGLLVEGE